MHFDDDRFPDCLPPTPGDELRDVAARLLYMIISGRASGQVKVDNVESDDGTLHLNVDVFVNSS